MREPYEHAVTRQTPNGEPDACVSGEKYQPAPSNVPSSAKIRTLDTGSHSDVGVLVGVVELPGTDNQTCPYPSSQKTMLFVLVGLRFKSSMSS